MCGQKCSGKFDWKCFLSTMSSLSLTKQGSGLQNLEKHPQQQGFKVILIHTEFEATHGHMTLALKNKQVNKLTHHRRYFCILGLAPDWRQLKVYCSVQNPQESGI